MELPMCTLLVLGIVMMEHCFIIQHHCTSPSNIFHHSAFECFHLWTCLHNTLRKHCFMSQNHKSQREYFDFFWLDAFHYLSLKVGGYPAVKASLSRSKRIVKYYDSRKTESGSRVNNIAYLCIITVSALNSLRGVLGSGIGVGAAGNKPSKSRPLQYCTIGSLLSSIERDRVL